MLLRPDGAKYWRWDYRRPVTGTRNTLSPGTYPDVSLASVRERHAAARKLFAEGVDPGDIQKLRAAERSALSLAEEYQAMEYEMATELPSMELELAEVADSCIKGKHDSAKQVAEQAYEQLLTQAGEQIAVVFELFTMAENGGKIHREM